jgi:sn-glycerol 3-phosphate transport system substrate-binding protein
VWLTESGLPGVLAPLYKQAEEVNKAHPDYTVVVTPKYYLDMPKEVAAAAAKGQAPDVAQLYYTDAQVGQDMKVKGTPVFKPLQQALAGRKEIAGEKVVVDELLPAARDYYTSAGQLWSMPKNVSSTVMYSNNALLKQAGITSVPTTWGELEAACAKVVALPSKPTCATWPNHGWFFEQAIASQGGTWADNDNGHTARAEATNLASPEMLNWVTWWKGMYDKGYYTYTGFEEDYLGTSIDFSQGNTAFTLNSSEPAEFFVGAGQAFGGVEVSRMPYNQNVPYAGHMVGGDSLFLAAGLDKKTEDGSLAFMNYLNSVPNTSAASASGGFLPVTTTAVRTLAGTGLYDQKPYLQVALNQLSDPRRFGPGPVAATLPGPNGPRYGNFMKIEYVASAAMEDVLLHGADPYGRFTQANADAQQLLTAYNTQAQG